MRGQGTEIYNPEAGGFTDLSMLDVMQIFGRAGRPQVHAHARRAGRDLWRV